MGMKPSVIVTVEGEAVDATSVNDPLTGAGIGKGAGAEANAGAGVRLLGDEVALAMTGAVVVCLAGVLRAEPPRRPVVVACG
jgi:hypothetical protein